MTMRQYFIAFAIFSTVLLLALGLIWKPVFWGFLLLGPIIALGVIDMLQTRQTLRRLYPVLSHFRYMFEACLLYTSPSPRDS